MLSDFITHTKRTHYCGDLNETHAGADVVLMGWVERRRDLGNLIFVNLRDRTGVVQVVFNPETIDPAMHEQAHRIRNEYVLALAGRVTLRPADMANPSLKTGKIEVSVTRLDILNESSPLPFLPESETDTSENTRLTYRYLDLRRKDIQRNLMLRSTVALETRRYLQQEGFIEVETPVLTKSTPEGARDYLVPSRINPGTFYALPQSPQIFKQLLMISGFDRYFQIVKCFRDEDLRADRQPEFTQIDMEMSFVSEDDIISTIEGLMPHLFKMGLDREIEIPFPRLTYREAIDRYGLDNPDTRFSLELKDLTDIVKDSGFKVFSDTAAKGGLIKAINVGSKQTLSRKELDGLSDFVGDYGARGLIWAKIKEEGWASSIAKFLTKEEIEAINSTMEASTGDTLLIVAGTPGVVNGALGNLRNHLARKLDLIPADTFSFVWITEFPMFEYSETEDRYVSTHHPFTSPAMEDLPVLTSDPGRVRARAYDLVLNGSEIGGGSIRIHRREVQSLVFDVLGLSEEESKEKFGFLLEALEYGTPPHGGIAFGFDRIIAIMAGAESIRDIIAFPKTNRASCLLTGAPSPVDTEQLKELSLKTI